MTDLLLFLSGVIRSTVAILIEVLSHGTSSELWVVTVVLACRMTLPEKRNFLEIVVAE